MSQSKFTSLFASASQNQTPAADAPEAPQVTPEETLSDVEKSLWLERKRFELENRTTGGMRAYLVGIEQPDEDPREVQESLQELGALVRTLGDDCQGVLVQKRARPVPATFVGHGKAEEIRLSCKQLDIDYVAFDNELSPTQVRNLEKIFERPVLDRTGIILQIFRKNARTREARTQVEIARLEYLAPRISNAWIAWERQRGGGSGGAKLRGAGEMQLEIDRRNIRDKIAFLKRELEKIQTERKEQRKGRQDEFNVVLVGYTNAGKTTLMNGLTEANLSARDALFETLDSSVRRLKGVQNPNILVTDTVGFIRNLPHGLVASFRSTLEETRHADLLLHVVDASNPLFKEHMMVTDEVLKTVGAAEVPRFYVFNKIDQLKNTPYLGKVLQKQWPQSICISGMDETDIQKLRQSIVHTLTKDMREEVLHIPHSDTRRMGLLYSSARILHIDWDEEGGTFRVKIPKALWEAHFAPPQNTPSESSAVTDPWESGSFSLKNPGNKS